VLGAGTSLNWATGLLGYKNYMGLRGFATISEGIAPSAMMPFVPTTTTATLTTTATVTERVTEPTTQVTVPVALLALGIVLGYVLRGVKR